MNTRRYSFVSVCGFFAVLLLSATVVAAAPAGSPAPSKAKYVFLFIGDGTSIPQRNAAELYLASLSATKEIAPSVERAKGGAKEGITDIKPAAQRLLMNSFPAQGLCTTYSANSLITDSSSAATAMASGIKTQDGVVGMDPKGQERYPIISKMAKAKGYKVGIVTSVSIDHATPAAFYAHSPHRDLYHAIAEQIPVSGFDYFAGGGMRQPTGEKKDKPDLHDAVRQAGYTLVNTREAFLALPPGAGKVMAINPVLDSSKAMPYDMDRGEGEIALSEFVAKGIELLTHKSDSGFFMMAEGGKIDWACHANDAVPAIKDVIALDKAVAVAYEFYKKHPQETLIIVTGDHETGGMAVGFAGTRYDAFFTRLHQQKGSYIAFNTLFAAFKKKNPTGAFKDFIPSIESFYGLKFVSDEDRAALKAKAKTGDADAVAALALVLEEHEVRDLQAAFDLSMLDKKSRPQSGEAYLLYGSYEPISVTLTHILNRKAGIAWTTYSHSALPAPVSAVGVGAENFMGYYDNTDIFKKTKAIMGL